jgi:hypothetical protein
MVKKRQGANRNEQTVNILPQSLARVITPMNRVVDKNCAFSPFTIGGICLYTQSSRHVCRLVVGYVADTKKGVWAQVGSSRSLPLYVSYSQPLQNCYYSELQVRHSRLPSTFMNHILGNLMWLQSTRLSWTRGDDDCNRLTPHITATSAILNI